MNKKFRTIPGCDNTVLCRLSMKARHFKEQSEGAEDPTDLFTPIT